MTAMLDLQDREVFFILNDISTWRLAPTIALFFAMCIAFEFISNFTPYFQEFVFHNDRVSPGGAILHKRVTKDYVFLAFNKCITSVFMVHFIRHMASSECVQGLANASLLNSIAPLPLMFVAYDFFYSPFHRFMHWKPVYPFVHKHHHRFVAVSSFIERLCAARNP